MDGMLGTLCAGVFLLAVVTVVGHGLFVVLSFLFKTEEIKESPPPPTGSDAYCPTCRSPLIANRRLCKACGWPLHSPAQAPRSVGLEAVQRELARLVRLNLLDAATSERLVEAVRLEQSKLAASTVPLADASPKQSEQPATAEPAETAEPEELVLKPAGIVEPAAAAPHPQPMAAELAAEVGYRVQAYTQRRSTAPSEPDEVAAPAAPDRPWSQLLTHFMEEKNIRWGELVGGLLIVCCSIALVISFWSKIAERPFIKFFVFNGVTAGLFGLGFYIHRRWKLRTTSQGLLTIGTLLVPLNFLAIAAFSEGATPASPWMIGGELVSIALFSALVYAAARIVAGREPIALTLGVVGCAVSELLARRFVAPGVGLSIIAALAAVPLACYLGAVGAMLWRARLWPDWGEGEAGELFELLGTVTFAAAIAEGLLLVKTGEVWPALCQLAPLVSLSGVPAMAVGLLLMRRLTRPELAGMRTAGTSLAVLGAGLLLAGVALAWTNPASLVLVGIADCVVFAAIALAFEIPAAQLLAVAALVPAWLAVFHVLAGHIHWQQASRADMAHAFMSAASGSALVPLAALIGCAAWGLGDGARAAHARFYALGAAGVAIASLALVLVFGFGRTPDAGATWVILLYALVVLAAGFRVGPLAIWGGSALLLAAFIQGVVFRYDDILGSTHPWLAALLGHSSIITLAAASQIRRTSLAKALEAAWRNAALTTSLVAVPQVANLVCWEPPGVAAAYTLWLAALWFGLACLGRWPILFSAFQVALSVAVALGAATFVATHQWLDPRRLQAQGVALALLSGGWIAVRLALRRFPAARLLVAPSWPSVDRVVTGLLVVLLLGLACYGSLPAVAHELAPRAAALHASDSLATFSIIGMPAGQALGPGTWWLLLALLAVFAARQWESFTPLAILAAMLALWAGCPLLAGRFPGSAASTLRWCAASYALVLSLPIWFRGLVVQAARRFGWPEIESRSANLPQQATWLLMAVGILPVLCLTILPALAAIAGHPLNGPAAGSFFARIGMLRAFLVPLGLAFATLVGHAARERSPTYAFAAGLVLNLATSLGFALSIVTAGGQIGTAELYRLVQFNALASGGFALAWSAANAWSRRRQTVSGPQQPSFLFSLQAVSGAAILALLLVPNLWRLVAQPASSVPFFQVAGFWGWTASVVAFAAWTWFCLHFIAREQLRRYLSGLLAAALLTAVTLAAFEASRWDVGNWLAYHTLMIGGAIAAWLLLAAVVGMRATGRPSVAVPWTSAIGGSIVLLALRAWNADPGSPWWSVGVLAALVPLAAAMAGVVARQEFLWAAAGLINLAANMAWIERPLWWPVPASFSASLVALVEVNAAALALPAIAWLLIDLRFIYRLAPKRLLPTHQLVAGAALAILMMVTAVLLAADFSGSPILTSRILDWCTISAVTVATMSCLWDPRARWPVAGLYALGLTVLAIVVSGYNLSPRWLLWTGMMLAAAYSLATSYLWSRRQGLLAMADRLAIPRRAGPIFSGLTWLVPANWLLAVTVMIACFAVELTFSERASRLLSGNAAIVQAIAVGMLARGRRRSQLRSASLWFAVLGAVAWGWAWIHPGSPARLLDRAVVVTVALASMTVVYGLGSKFLPLNEWTRSARRLVPSLLALGGASLCAVLALELRSFAIYGQVAIAWPAMIAVVAALAALVAAALVAALLPGRDPLHLSERGRTIYVYAAEALLALLLLHVRLTLPWLFRGLFLRYWPLVVMLVAFAGVGLAELFRRRRQAVLAEPLERTGVLLPLLPVLGYWVAPATELHYSLQLLAVGMLYAVLSVTRRSFGFGLFAALAANGGLWFFLNEQGQYGLLVHPQLWLIPPAISVLVAAYLNRDRLDTAQMTAIRYLTTVTIYVSSTADIFLNGVAQAPWLPFVLAGISLAGVALGIMLQVRAFLFLGTAFLVLSLLTMIWHAAVDLEQTWLWAATGIVTGILIIAVFAAFEKKRDDVLLLVERLRDWDS